MYQGLATNLAVFYAKARPRVCLESKRVRLLTCFLPTNQKASPPCFFWKVAKNNFAFEFVAFGFTLALNLPPASCLKDAPVWPSQLAVGRKRTIPAHWATCVPFQESGVSFWVREIHVHSPMRVATVAPGARGRGLVCDIALLCLGFCRGNVNFG